MDTSNKLLRRNLKTVPDSDSNTAARPSRSRSSRKSNKQHISKTVPLGFAQSKVSINTMSSTVTRSRNASRKSGKKMRKISTNSASGAYSDPELVFSQAAKIGSMMKESGGVLNKVPQSAKKPQFDDDDDINLIKPISETDYFFFKIPLKQCCSWLRIMIDTSKSWEKMSIGFDRIIGSGNGREDRVNIVHQHSDDVMSMEHIFSIRKTVYEIVTTVRDELFQSLLPIIGKSFIPNQTNAQHLQWEGEIALFINKIRKIDDRNTLIKIKFTKQKLISLWLNYLKTSLKTGNDTGGVLGGNKYKNSVNHGSSTSATNTISESDFQNQLSLLSSEPPFGKSPVDYTHNHGIELAPDVRDRWADLFPKLLEDLTCDLESGLSLYGGLQQRNNELKSSGLSPMTGSNSHVPLNIIHLQHQAGEIANQGSNTTHNNVSSLSLSLAIRKNVRDQIYQDWDVEDFHNFGVSVPGFVQVQSLAKTVYKLSRQTRNAHSIQLTQLERTKTQMEINLHRIKGDCKQKITEYYLFKRARLDAKRRKQRQIIAEKRNLLNFIKNETENIIEPLKKITKDYWNFRIEERQKKAVLLEWVKKSQNQETRVGTYISDLITEAVRLEGMVDQTIGPIVEWCGTPNWRILHGKDPIEGYRETMLLTLVEEEENSSNHSKIALKDELGPLEQDTDTSPKTSTSTITSENENEGVVSTSTMTKSKGKGKSIKQKWQKNKQESIFDIPTEPAQNLFTQLQSALLAKETVQRILENDLVEYCAAMIIQRQTRKYFENKRRLAWLEENPPPVVESIPDPIEEGKKKKKKKKKSSKKKKAK